MKKLFTLIFCLLSLLVFSQGKALKPGGNSSDRFDFSIGGGFGISTPAFGLRFQLADKNKSKGAAFLAGIGYYPSVDENNIAFSAGIKFLLLRYFYLSLHYGATGTTTHIEYVNSIPISSNKKIVYGSSVMIGTEFLLSEKFGLYGGVGYSRVNGTSLINPDIGIFINF